MESGNLFSGIPEDFKDEVVQTLLKTDHFRLERIISSGQATPAGQWYDQETDEWVILLKGGAGLLFEGEGEVRVLRAGDYVHIPAHMRHRVEWTEVGEKTVWMAIHHR